MGARGRRSVFLPTGVFVDHMTERGATEVYNRRKKSRKRRRRGGRETVTSVVRDPFFKRTSLERSRRGVPREPTLGTGKSSSIRGLRSVKRERKWGWGFDSAGRKFLHKKREQSKKGERQGIQCLGGTGAVTDILSPW